MNTGLASNGATSSINKALAGIEAPTKLNDTLLKSIENINVTKLNDNAINKLKGAESTIENLSKQFGKLLPLYGVILIVHWVNSEKPLTLS